MGELGESIIGLTYKPTDVKSDGWLVLRSSNVQDGWLAFEDNVYVDADVPKRLVVREGDILVCVRNGSRPLIGKCALIIGNPKNTTFGAFMAVYRSRYGHYIFQQFQSDLIKRQIHEHLGATINQITNASLNSFEVPFPDEETERAVIAQALFDTDELIRTIEKLIAKKRNIKQAAMQQLLTGKKRLPGFTGDWQPTPLSKLGTTYGGLTGKTKADFGSGNARYIPFLNVLNNTVIDAKVLDRVSIGTREAQNEVRGGDLFFNGSSETPEDLGLCSVLDLNLKGVYLNSFCFGFRPYVVGSFNGLFLAYYFRSRPGRELLYSLAQGATRYNLSKTALLRVELPMPLVEEQDAIASTLSDMSAEIDMLEARRDKTHAIKLAMMQQLLTGKVRLV